MPTLDEIREQFPNPRTAYKTQGETLSPKDYCVGGALCQFLKANLGIPGVDHTPGFPTEDKLTDVLYDAFGPRVFVSWMEAHDFAREIISYNDDEYFEEAWLIVQEILEKAEQKGDSHA